MVISLFLLIMFLKYLLQNSCYSKLEKADILEMTVQHLKNLKNQQITGWCGLSRSFADSDKITNIKNRDILIYHYFCIKTALSCSLFDVQ